jgi:dTDP-4-amino-4,6-dideoxygalactose transaminase
MAIRQPPASLAAVTDERDVVFVSSGRAAIFLAMEALEVGRRDRVLVPTYHCPTMIAPVERLGATPVFYPINRNGTPDLEWLSAIDTSGVKALLAAHFFGLPQAMAGVKQYCVSRGIALIEDCAHAFFGASESTQVGAFGDLAIASLPKFFPVAEGGCLIGPKHLLERVKVTSPAWLAELRALLDPVELGASHGRLGIPGRAFDALASLKRRLRRPGRKLVLSKDELAEASQSEWLDETLLRRRSTAATRWIVRHTGQKRLIEGRRTNYALWARLLQDVDGAQPLFAELPDAAAPYVFPLRVSDPEAKYQAFRASGIPVFRWDVVWPNTPSIEGDEGRLWQTEIFQLGCHQDLSQSDIQRLAAAVRRLVEPSAARHQGHSQRSVRDADDTAERQSADLNSSPASLSSGTRR